MRNIPTACILLISITAISHADVTEWFATGVGVINTESKSGGTAITAIN